MKNSLHFIPSYTCNLMIYFHYLLLQTRNILKVLVVLMNIFSCLFDGWKYSFCKLKLTDKLKFHKIYIEFLKIYFSNNLKTLY